MHVSQLLCCEATLALVHSAAEYCASVWCRSAHTCLIASAINDALRIMTGCLRPTPADNLPILAGIQPVEFRRNGVILSVVHRAMEPGRLLHSTVTSTPSGNAQRLKSRHPFVPAAQLISSSDSRVRRSGRITDGMRSDWTTLRLRGSVLSSPEPTHLESPLQEQCGSGSTASVSDVSAPACTSEVLPSMRPVSVTKNQPPTMSSSNVQCIDPLMDCTPWRFWTMRQLNGWSTSPAATGGFVGPSPTKQSSNPPKLKYETL